MSLGEMSLGERMRFRTRETLPAPSAGLVFLQKGNQVLPLHAQCGGTGISGPGSPARGPGRGR